MEKNHRPLLLLFILIGIYSCDYISNPIEPKPIPPNPDDCPAVTFPTNPNPHRKVLVEDYTGHTCLNCPQAAKKAVELENMFGDGVIIVAVHAGYFAEPDAKAGFPEDFRTDAGEVYDQRFGASAAGNPQGLINRKDYPNSPTKAPLLWQNEVTSILNTPIEADVIMMCEYNKADSTVCINIQTKFLTAMPADRVYNLTVMFIQDSIKAPQKDGSAKIDDYWHRHVVRDLITSNFGDSLTVNPNVNEPILKKYRYKIKHDYASKILKPKGTSIVCKPENCYLVAFLSDKNTYRILQAEEVKIIK
jgi:hypothetical protein